MLSFPLAAGSRQQVLSCFVFVGVPLHKCFCSALEASAVCLCVYVYVCAVRTVPQNEV